MFHTDTKQAGRKVRLEIDGVWHDAIDGQMLSATLLAADVRVFRRTMSGSGRAPHCLIGVCHECLVTVDGVASRQACQVVVADGMRVQTQRVPALDATP